METEEGQQGSGRKTRRAWLREEDPAFQELAQIPAEATTLLWCPNHSQLLLGGSPRGLAGQRTPGVGSGLEGNEGGKQAGCGD